MDKKTPKRKSQDLPACQYGGSCYRQNPEHLKNFRHPKQKRTNTKGLKLKEKKENNEDFHKKVQPSDEKILNDATAVKEKILEDCLSENDQMDDKSNEEEVMECSGTESSQNSSLDPDVPKFYESVENILKDLPSDFHDFWEFCSSVNKAKPQDAFAKLGLHLTGPYDLLVRKLPKQQKVDILCHCRFFYDPPEFQAVITTDDEDLYHIGYYRDDPEQGQRILASNRPTKGPQLALMGDNIFAAVNSEIGQRIRKCKSKELKEKFTTLQENLAKFAKSKKYSVDIVSSKTKARSKKVNSKTFHGLGIVVPVKDDVGYRPLPETDAKLKNILKRIVSADSKTKQLEEEERLDDIVTNVHIGNDECDFGMGLEFGIDLFCYGDPYFHKMAVSILSLAYDLLNRRKYGHVIRAHLANRRKGGDLSCLHICED